MGKTCVPSFLSWVIWKLRYFCVRNSATQSLIASFLRMLSLFSFLVVNQQTLVKLSEKTYTLQLSCVNCVFFLVVHFWNDQILKTISLEFNFHYLSKCFCRKNIHGLFEVFQNSASVFVPLRELDLQ